MIWTLVGVLVLLSVFALAFLSKRRRQVRFIQETLRESGRADSKRVIASFSTLPDRIHNLEATIRCLLNQTRPPDEIVLSIPEFSVRQQKPYVLPKYLAQFPRLRILHCEKDWGPATKFIPVIQEELEEGRGDTVVMVVDDDRVYPHDALETYLHYYEHLPRAALCFRGGAMPSNFNWFIPKLVLGSRIRKPARVAVITGCGSYLIQPRFFDSALWNYSDAPTGAFYMDDIWISGNLDRREVEKYVIPTSAMMRTVRQQSGTMSLHWAPRGRTRYNNETIQFFRDDWNVFSRPRIVGLRPDLAARVPTKIRFRNIFSGPKCEHAEAEIEK
jgi:hypothetical protein